MMNRRMNKERLMTRRSKTIPKTTTTAYRIKDLTTGLYLYAHKVRPEDMHPDVSPHWHVLGSIFSSADDAAASLQYISSKISPLWCVEEIHISSRGTWSIPPIHSDD